jgi:hypothetical protein
LSPLADGDDLAGKLIVAAVAAIITGAFSLLIWWLSKKKPNIIQVRDVELSSLLRVAGTIRPRIKSTFDDRPVNALSQIDYEVFNTGPDIIKDIQIDFSFKPETIILGCELSGVQGQYEIVGQNELRLRIPYLNAHKPHKDALVAKVVCDGDVDPVRIKGRGEGWSARYASLRGIVLFRARVSIGLVVVALFLVVAQVILAPTPRFDPNAPHDLISTQALAVQLPLLGAVVAILLFVALWCLRPGLRAVKRLKRD